MKKSFSVLILVVCLLLIVGGCAPDLQLGGEQQELLPYEYYGVDQTGYASLNELVENTSSESVKLVLQAFPENEFTDVMFFTSYNMYDEDRNSPVSGVAFKHNGGQYFFAGAAEENVFFWFDHHAQVFWYSAVDGEGTVMVPVQDEKSSSISLSYPDKDEQYTLASDSPKSPDELFEILSLITGATYKCIDDDVIYVDNAAGTVSAYFISYQLAGADYRLSNENVLSEIYSTYEAGEQEVQIFTEDPEEAGADLVTYPSSLSLEFEVIGDGRVTIEILGENNDVLYSADITVDQDMGAFIEKEWGHE